ncbi:MAG: Alpha-1,3-mannosyltransferase-like protein [Alectoria fallacina]|uniref:Alpha-1,3/1,6-mannosyltransferase ALG2 n=1 Tax=Alectoria fallacina TaxID=1903189 RepID=A0A8H3J1U3_9LECA|nr:MAG: Alpha-1,3-mannosyltransferase-like protein [Alectoria fallacina]
MERKANKSENPKSPPNATNIVFFHPDLGIGGAERLIIDAAVGLQNLGHKITIFTSYRDTNHCFDEARDGTLDIRVRGGSLIPATILGRFKILCSILRQLHLLLAITWSGELATLKPTAFFIDQLSAGIPFLRWFWEDQKILFYCHFPDLLLVQGRKSWYKRIWRIGFDWLEGWGIRGADRVIVNSGFTKGVVENMWEGLGGGRGVGVVYPCVDTKEHEKFEKDSQKDSKPLWKDKRVLLSINRFERKKDVGLAIKAFAGLDPEEREGVRLVIAGILRTKPQHLQAATDVEIGGYDPQVRENVLYHHSLETLATSLSLTHTTTKNLVSALSIPSSISILFLLSVPSSLKSSLLNSARLLIYTPSNEHFGIVPLEAMLAGVPVLAANSGGPLETVLDPATGWLRDVEKVEQWTDVMKKVLGEMSDEQLRQMGANGKGRVREEFSETKMARKLNEEIEDMVKRRRVLATELGDVALSIPILGGCLFTIGAVLRAAYNTKCISMLEMSLGSLLISVAFAGIIGIIYKLQTHESAFR